MMKQNLINFLLIVMLLVSCTGNRKYDDLMQRADSIMNVDDDSAKVAIRLLDGLQSQLPDFTKGQRMRYELLYHKAMNKAYIPFKSDSIMLEVADYYEHHGSANDRMLAYYILGCVYRDMHEAPTALEFYHKATEQADTTESSCDYRTLYKIYGQMGILFDKQYLPYQELKAFRLAEKYAYCAKDTFNAITNYHYQEGAYCYLNKIDSAIFINLQAAKLYKEYGDDVSASLALGSNLGYYIDKNDIKQAKKSFEAFLLSKDDGNSADYPDAKSYLSFMEGKYYMFANQFDSAYSCLHESLKLSKSYGNKAAAAKGLAQFYTILNQSSLAEQYALQSLEYQDSDFIETRNSQLQQIQAMYDYSRNRDLAVIAEKKAMQRVRIIYMLIIGSFVVLLFVSYFYKRNLTIKKKKMAVTKLLYEDCLIQLKKQQMELVELKVEKDNSLAKIIREKEETIYRLKEEVREIQDKYSLSFLPEADVLLKNSSIYKKFLYVEMHPKTKLVEEDWGELATTVENIIPSFVPILKDVLSEKEYRVCLLVRLGLSVSFIGTLVGLSVSGVSAIRKRMMEKVCHKSGSPKDFDNFISHL